MIKEYQQVIRTATVEIQAFYGRAAILFPEEAVVEWHDFNPFHAVQSIATVKVPGIWHCKERTFIHTIIDGDRVNWDA